MTKTVTEILKHTTFMQVPYMHRTVPITVIPEESSSDESFCLQLQAQSNHAEGKQIPNPVHLMTGTLHTA